MRLVVPTVVYLDHWTSSSFGDRYSLVYEDRALVTRGTEFEARQVAREYGWRIEKAEMGEEA